MHKYDPQYIDQEERELMGSIETMDVGKLSKPSKVEQDKIRLAAKEFKKKHTKMNIRIDPFELERIKEQADLAGLKYQTFIKSVLHKYITGQLIEKDKLSGYSGGSVEKV